MKTMLKQQLDLWEFFRRHDGAHHKPEIEYTLTSVWLNIEGCLMGEIYQSEPDKETVWFTFNFTKNEVD